MLTAVFSWHCPMFPSGVRLSDWAEDEVRGLCMVTPATAISDHPHNLDINNKHQCSAGHIMTIWWRFHLSYAEVVTINFTWHYTWAGGAAGQWPGTSQTSGQSATCSIVPLLSYRDQQHLPWWYRHDDMKYIMYLLSTLHNICPCCSKFHAYSMCESTSKYGHSPGLQM